MRLARFKSETTVHFGFKLEKYLFPFSLFQDQLGDQASLLKTIEDYLSDIDPALKLAQKAYEIAEKQKDSYTLGKDYYLVEDVELLKPIERPTMFYDVMASPTHVYLSGKTMLKYEAPKLIHTLHFDEVILRKHKKNSQDLSTPEVFTYYKGNTNSFDKSEDPLIWPEFSSYTDVEPELMFITGNSNKNKVAGFLVLNDCSARDIQYPEIKEGLGPQRSKDYQNIMSPYIVTPDEIDPYNLEIEVKIGNRHHWTGKTDKYNATAEQLIAFFEKTRPVEAGTLIGMGTAPRCTCMDNDLWLLPGDEISIEFKGLGKMTHTLNAPKRLTKDATRWGERKELKEYYNKN